MSKCVDIYNFPLEVNDEIQVYDGNPRSLTYGAWIRGTITHIPADQTKVVGVYIVEDHPLCPPRIVVPVRNIRRANVEEARCVIEFTDTKARVIIKDGQRPSEEWIDLDKVIATEDAQTAKAWARWDAALKEYSQADDNDNTPVLADDIQAELAEDVKQAITRMVLSGMQEDHRTYQRRLLTVAVDIIIKWCVWCVPNKLLHKVISSWDRRVEGHSGLTGKFNLPLGEKIKIIVLTWNVYRALKNESDATVTKEEPPRGTTPLPVVNLACSEFRPTLETHSFYQAKYPPGRDELQINPVGASEYPRGFLPAFPGPCTSECEVKNGSFCFYDHMKRSEPPKWRLYALEHDRSINDKKKKQDKWNDRERRAKSFNENIQFMYKYGTYTPNPIAPSSHYERTKHWRAQMRAAINRRLAKVPLSALQYQVFEVPAQLWYSKESPLSISIKPELKGLEIDEYTHKLDGRLIENNAVTGPVEMTVCGTFLTTKADKKYEKFTFTIHPNPSPDADIEPYEPDSEQEKLGLAWAFGNNLDDKFKPISVLIKNALEIERLPKFRLEAVTLLARALHGLRTSPMIYPAPYEKRDIANFKKLQKEGKTNPKVVNNGHGPKEEKDPTYLLPFEADPFRALADTKSTLIASGTTPTSLAAPESNKKTPAPESDATKTATCEGPVSDASASNPEPKTSSEQAEENETKDSAPVSSSSTPEEMNKSKSDDESQKKNQEEKPTEAGVVEKKKIPVPPRRAADVVKPFGDKGNDNAVVPIRIPAPPKKRIPVPSPPRSDAVKADSASPRLSDDAKADEKTTTTTHESKNNGEPALAKAAAAPIKRELVNGVPPSSEKASKRGELRDDKSHENDDVKKGDNAPKKATKEAKKEKKDDDDNVFTKVVSKSAAPKKKEGEVKKEEKKEESGWKNAGGWNNDKEWEEKKKDWKWSGEWSKNGEDWNNSNEWNGDNHKSKEYGDKGTSKDKDADDGKVEKGREKREERRKRASESRHSSSSGRSEARSHSRSRARRHRRRSRSSRDRGRRRHHSKSPGRSDDEKDEKKDDSRSRGRTRSRNNRRKRRREDSKSASRREEDEKRPKKEEERNDDNNNDWGEQKWDDKNGSRHRQGKGGGSKSSSNHWRSTSWKSNDWDKKDNRGGWGGGRSSSSWNNDKYNKR